MAGFFEAAVDSAVPSLPDEQSLHGTVGNRSAPLLVETLMLTVPAVEITDDRPLFGPGAWA